MRRLLGRFAAARGASVLTLFALSLPVLIGGAAFGVDAGVFFLERRALQKAADAAALAAVADPGRAEATVRRMLAANAQGDARFTLAFGRYHPDAARSRDERFEPGGAANAVSVEATREIPTLFARIFGRTSGTIAVRAQAATTPVVSFSIGSRLAAVDPPLLDAVLRPLIGSPLGLQLLDYRALAASRIKAGALLRELAAAGGMGPGAKAGDVLRRPILLSAFLSVTAAELNATGDPAGAAALRKAARNTVGLALRVVPADLVGLDDNVDELRLDYPNDALAAKVSVLSLVSAAITDRSIGNEVSAGLGLPGIARADLRLILGEAAKSVRGAVVTRFGENSLSAQTAQVRLRLAVRADAAALLPGLEADLPFELVAAGARLDVVSATCSADPAKREVRLAVLPGLLRLSLGSSGKALADMTVEDKVRPAAIAAGSVLRIEAGGTVALKRLATVAATFRGAEIGSGVAKTVRTRNLAESLVTTLMDETEIGVRLEALGLGLGLPDTIKRSARVLLVGLARPVDDVLDAALAAAGIGLGEADLRVDDVVCGQPRLIG